MAGSLTVLNSRIELQEYGKAVNCEASKLDLNALFAANLRWKKTLGLSSDPIKVEHLSDGSLSLRAEAVTGVVRIGRTDIEIAPKFLGTGFKGWQAVLWKILTIVEGGHVDSSFTSASDIKTLSLPDLLAEIFINSYSLGAARGLPRCYQSESDQGSFLRGSFDATRINRWLVKPWQIPYISDVLTDDTQLSRLLRWAASCLADTVNSPSRGLALREIANELSHVGNQPPHIIDGRNIHLGVQHYGLEPAKVVGLLLLEGSGVHHASGSQELSGFLWNSDLIYENFVLWLCKKAARKRNERATKNGLSFGEVISGNGSVLITTPDVVFRNNSGSCVAITDSKYKQFGTKPKAADTYQVLAAANLFGCQRVSLTYPVSENRLPTVWRIPSKLGGADVELTALPINLMSLSRPEGFDLLIGNICEWLDGDLFS